MTTTSSPLARALAEIAVPFTASTAAPPGPAWELLRRRASGAQVVGIGDPVRGAREVMESGDRIVRLLVEQLGFRVLAVETPEPGGQDLDAYLLGGSGDLDELVRGLWAPWHLREFADTLTWLRGFNERHPDDPVRFAGVDGPDLEDLAKTDRQFSVNIRHWHERTGSPVVYWGGIAHAAVGDPLRPSGWSPRTSAGAYLRHHFGESYLSVGLTVHSGAGRGLELPEPPPDFAEAALGGLGPEPLLVDLRPDWPDPVDTWMRAPAKTRVVGPTFTAQNHAEYFMSGASLREWFDVLVHHPRVSHAEPLD